MTATNSPDRAHAAGAEEAHAAAAPTAALAAAPAGAPRRRPPGAAAAEAAEFLSTDWFAERLWRLLVVPADIGCRAVCEAWALAATTSSSRPSLALASAARGGGAERGPRRLRCPHLLLVRGELGDRALRWALGRLEAGLVETVELPVAWASSFARWRRANELVPPRWTASPPQDVVGYNNIIRAIDEDWTTPSSVVNVASIRSEGNPSASNDFFEPSDAWHAALHQCSKAGAADWVAWLFSARSPLLRSLGDASAPVFLRFERGCLRWLSERNSFEPWTGAAQDGVTVGGGVGAEGQLATPATVPGMVRYFRAEARSFGALRAAAAAGHAAVVHLLVAASADVLAMDENDCTALHWAADSGHAEACQVLLAGGAPVDARDDDDWTALCLAADEGHLAVCRVLLQARANVNLGDEDSRSPFWWSVWRGHDELARFLLSCRANPAQADINGIAPQKVANVADDLLLEQEGADAQSGAAVGPEPRQPTAAQAGGTTGRFRFRGAYGWGLSATTHRDLETVRGAIGVRPVRPWSFLFAPTSSSAASSVSGELAAWSSEGSGV